ncbi:MAG: hypothetical protein AAB688_01360 [Patescibacteria group bacterium]
MKLVSAKKIREFFGGKRRESEVAEINPSRDWKIILAFIVVIGVAMSGFSSYLYWRINSGGFFITSIKNDLPIETIDRNELKKVIQHYKLKGNQFQILKGEKPVGVDPSF